MLFKTVKIKCLVVRKRTVTYMLKLFISTDPHPPTDQKPKQVIVEVV